ncbi:MAG: hypothetical protein FJ161_01025 [Gammaproteobacteria bacterium]|nr:hypothetical protein [Gammaproteobacteria bacterium]
MRLLSQINQKYIHGSGVSNPETAPSFHGYDYNGRAHFSKECFTLNSESGNPETSEVHFYIPLSKKERNLCCPGIRLTNMLIGGVIVIASSGLANLVTSYITGKGR